jgi:hypothetical protein
LSEIGEGVGPVEKVVEILVIRLSKELEYLYDLSKLGVSFKHYSMFHQLIEDNSHCPDVYIKFVVPVS